MDSSAARAQRTSTRSRGSLGQRLRRAGALLLLAPMLGVVALQAPAQAANNVGVPTGGPPPGQAKLVVKKGGDRTSLSTVGPLAGATFRFYRVTSGFALTGGTLMPDTCTTDATGQCGVFVPLSGTGDNYFYGEEIATPGGWSEADVWGSSTDYLRYNSGAVRTGNTDRTRLLPPSGRTWPNVRDNPTAPQKCGLDIRMILDVSGSIDDTELATFKNAARGVVDALADTPSRVSLSRFASQAANVSSLTSVSSAAGVTTVKSSITGINRDGLNGIYTNWDRALWGSATTGETYDVALIITDGDPTVNGNETDGGSGDSSLQDVEAAIHSANALKAKGTQVLSVGINLTSAASIKRLNLISSPGSTYTTSWQELGADLKDIASGACSKAITVRKVVKDWQGNVMAGSAESNGWQFTGALTSGTITSFPPTAATNNENGWTQAGVSINAGQTPTVTLTETPRAGWIFEGAVCSVDGRQVAVTSTQTPGQFKFPGRANATMTCTVTNKQTPPAPQLTLVKKVLNADGTLASASAGEAWMLSATGTSGGFSGAGNTAAVTGKEVTAGVQYTLGETLVPGYTNGTTWSCAKVSGPGTLTFSSPDKLTLGAGQVATCTITNQATLSDLKVSKTALTSYDRDYDWTIVKSVDNGPRFEVPQGTAATVKYRVVVTPSAAKHTNFKVKGVITVTNPNAVAIDGVTIVDSLPGAICALDSGAATRTINPGLTQVPYTCTLPDSTALDAAPTNTVKLTWDPAKYHGMTGSVQGTATADFAKATVSTTDATALVTDSMVDIDGTGPDGAVLQATGGQRTFTYERPITGTPGKCTTHDNTATVKPSHSGPASDTEQVTVCTAVGLGVVVDASGSFDRDNNWDITKKADETTFEVDAETGAAVAKYTVSVTGLAPTLHGYEMSGVATVSNPNQYGAVTLTGGTITATHGGGVTCAPTAAIAGRSVPAEGSIQVAFTCEFAGTPSPTGKVDVSVTWAPTGPGSSATVTGERNVTLVVDRELYATVDVVDDKTDPANPVLLEQGLQWKPGLVKDYIYKLTHAGVPGECKGFTNTAIVDLTPTREAWADAVDEDGNPVATEDVVVCVEAPLTASMTASGGLARDYAWAIDKSVDQTSVTVSGGTATFNYTVVVRAGASKDSAWRASGVVTVANPNDYGESEVDDSITLTGASMTNTFGAGVTCAPDAPVAGRVVPGDGSVQIPFTCTFANAPAANAGTISASVTWDPAGEADSDSAGASAGVTLGLDKETNKVVDVVDDKTVPGRRIVLEQGLVWSSGLVRTYTYSLVLPAGAAGSTTPYTNIATVDLPQGPDVSDTVTVQVSVPEVAPEQAFGKATGKVRASCQGTVTARMRNATGGRVTYVLKVGKKTHRIKVGSGKRKVFQTKGKARAKVVLKVGPQTLDRVRVPKLCLPPEVLPDTGLRAAANARLGSITHRWG